jgi:predicted TIM-barrel fold metal-dependent hydrolase
MSPERAVRLIRHYGVDHCMFGSDFPMWNPKKEAEILLSLGFTYEEYRQIFSENAKAFLGL